MFDPVLTEQELAALFRVPDKTVEALVAKTDLPRFSIEGKPRFLLASVLAWCQRHEGDELLPQLVEMVIAAPPPKPVRRITQLPAAQAGEHAWVDAESLDSLAGGAGDAGRNLDRLKLRDALLELNDALLSSLSRHSDGRLHPHYDEKSRTSPWRLELGSNQRIDTISMAWGSGEHAPSQFNDRPHLAVELSKGELRLVLDPHARSFAPPLDAATIDALLDQGIAVEMGADHATPVAFAKVYAMPDPAPTLATIVEALDADLARLIPLWAKLV